LAIRLTHGTRQRFRYRHQDITIRGEIDDLVPPLPRAERRLNGAAVRPFYVEQIADEGTDWVNGYKATPAELRCKELGEFCVEIAIDDPALREGDNRLVLATEDTRGRRHEVELYFVWDPRPVPLPLDLCDLSRFQDIQDVGQAINGAFDLDRAQNVIRSRAPVAPDAFLVLGSPHGSQEATYAVRFLEPASSKWLGVGDFMAGQEEGEPPRGLKVGWSSAGMAALSPRGEARSFIAWGDHSGRPEEWAIATHPPAAVQVEKGRLYRLRHQVCFARGIDRVRFRIWPADRAEPDGWLCSEQDDRVPAGLPRHRRASFGLFQHLGHPIEWSDILIKAHEPATDDMPEPGAGRQPFLKRVRPGAF
jgi:hypothetical protein